MDIIGLITKIGLNLKKFGNNMQKGEKVVIGIALFMVSLALLGFIGTAILKPKYTEDTEI